MNPNTMQTNPQLELAAQYVRHTGQHIFLTGKAGTGKTTFLHQLRETSPKRMVVLAPTGVAAINARGVTIHSFFQLPFGPLVDFERISPEKMRFSKEKQNIIRSLDLLVIDEISMVRADMLDAIDTVLRRFRTHSKPFGGVQLLMIGDLQQLSPVVTNDEREMIEKQYDTPYFFSSRVLQQTSFVSIELTQVFRQLDETFINLLNKVRDNNLDASAIALLNSRYVPNFVPHDQEGYLTLCTHNTQTQRINGNKLELLTTKSKTFKAQVEGNFPEYSYPTDFALTLKEGAQVMFVKNDSSSEKRYYNGKIGQLTRFDEAENTLYVRCPGDREEIMVSPEKWDNIRFALNPDTNTIEEQVEGTFVQIPLKLAWAITIHKSQGLTFEHVIIDAQASFAHGQVYVALSRCKTLEGIVLSTKIGASSVIHDNTVEGFTEHIQQNQPNEKQLSTARLEYQRELLRELFSFVGLRNRMTYIVKVVNDNTGSIPNLTQLALKQMQQPLQDEIVEVGTKFLQQIAQILDNQPDVEQNALAQTRIGKASSYFSDKVKTNVLDILAHIDLDLDNKTVKKQLMEAVNRLENETEIKFACLQACLSHFNVSELLKAKALAAIEKSKSKDFRKLTTANATAATTAAIANVELLHPILFDRLRAWRYEQSEILNLPAYGIFSQKVLHDLVSLLPADSRSLLKISGIGQKKLEQFGDIILEMINDYCEEYHVDRSQPIQAKITLPPKPQAQVVDTKRLTFNLYKDGKSVPEIIVFRGLKEDTIIGHLAHFIESGEVDATRLMPEVKLNAIVHYFDTHADKSFIHAKAEFGNGFSYNDLRVGLAHYNWWKKTH